MKKKSSTPVLFEEDEVIIEYHDIPLNIPRRLSDYGLYQLWTAIRIHFSSNYDFFQHGGKIRCQKETFERLNEKKIFAGIAAQHEGEKLYEMIFAYIGRCHDHNVHISSLTDADWLEMKRYTDAFKVWYNEDMEVINRQETAGLKSLVTLELTKSIHTETACMVIREFEISETPDPLINNHIARYQKYAQFLHRLKPEMKFGNLIAK